MASGVSTSVPPSASARSTSTASFSAAADRFRMAPDADFVGGSAAAFLAFVRLAGASLGFVTTLAAAILRTDINLVPFLDHFVFAQLELAVGDAFAGLDVILIAVPGAHEVEFGLREVQALRGLVGHDAAVAVLELGNLADKFFSHSKSSLLPASAAGLTPYRAGAGVKRGAWNMCL